MIFILLSLFAGMAEAQTKLVIFANDSLLGKKGFLTTVLPAFQTECACEVEAIRAGGSGAMIARYKLDLQAGRPSADVLMGLDQHLFKSSKELFDLSFDRSKENLLAGLKPELNIGPGFVPFDYGYFSLIADTKVLKQKNLALPTSLKELNHERYRKLISIQDPRTSSPGQAFVLFVSEVLGQGFSDFFKTFRNQWLTLAPDWESAYGIFLKEQTPFVWSYTSSQAYHEDHGDTEGRYKAVLFSEGAPMQIEGAALTRLGAKNADARRLAKQFFSFLLKPEIQKQIPATQSMYPVIDSVELPTSYKKLPVPARKVRGDQAGDPAQVLKLWEKAIQSPRP